MTDIVETVARAICLETGRAGDPLPVEMQRVNREWRDHVPAARAAIDAYEAAKIESLKERERLMLRNAGMPTSALEQAYINSVLRNGFKP